MLSRIADRLILEPTTHFIDPEQRKRHTIATPHGLVEAWVVSSGDDQDAPPEMIGLKFPGTAGRAERAGPHPFEIWPERRVDIWTINHLGYGGSKGRASLQNHAATCESVWQHLRALYPGIPITLIANSLGCVSALWIAARHQPRGLMLRNPVPLHQMISTRLRYNWWSFGLAKRIARQIPQELDAVENAQRSACPALFLRSELDRTTPARYQRMIYDRYAGPKTEFLIEGAQHHEPVGASQQEAYRRCLLQFGQALFAASGSADVV